MNVMIAVYELRVKIDWVKIKIDFLMVGSAKFYQEKHFSSVRPRTPWAYRVNNFNTWPV